MEDVRVAGELYFSLSGEGGWTYRYLWFPGHAPQSGIIAVVHGQREGLGLFLPIQGSGIASGAFMAIGLPGIDREYQIVNSLPPNMPAAVKLASAMRHLKAIVEGQVFIVTSSVEVTTDDDVVLTNKCVDVYVDHSKVMLVIECMAGGLKLRVGIDVEDVTPEGEGDKHETFRYTIGIIEELEDGKK